MTINQLPFSHQGITYGRMPICVMHCSNNQPPIANFTVSPANGIVPLTVTLDTIGSNDPDGTIEKYEWFVNEQLTSPSIGASPNKQIAFNSAGSYTIKLKVTDNDNLTNETQKTVTVTQNLVPDIRIEPTTLRFSQ